MLSNEVKKQAEMASIKWATLRRAKDELGVRSTKGKFDGNWYWGLPERGPKAREVGHDQCDHSQS